MIIEKGGFGDNSENIRALGLLGKRDRILEGLGPEDGLCAEKTIVINEAIGCQLLAKRGIRTGFRTRLTEVVSFGFPVF